MTQDRISNVPKDAKDLNTPPIQWPRTALALALLLGSVLSGCGRDPLFGPDPLQATIIREHLRAFPTGSEPEWVCTRPSEPVCACGTEVGRSAPIGGLSLEDRISLNHATHQELLALPGVGPTLARRIVARRDERPYTATSELLEVSGIGRARLRRLLPLIRID